MIDYVITNEEGWENTKMVSSRQKNRIGPWADNRRNEGRNQSRPEKK